MPQANLKEVMIKLPQVIAESLEKNEIVSLLLDKALQRLEYYRSQCQEMEQKYGMKYNDFKKRVEESKDEIFEEWDDLMEWEACEIASREWRGKYEELRACMAS